MIQIANNNSIVLLQKKEFLSDTFLLQILSSETMENYLKNFPFEDKQLFVDCDEDCFLVVDPKLSFIDTKSSASHSQSFAPNDPQFKLNATLIPIWKNGSLSIGGEDLAKYLAQFPPLCPFLAQDPTGKDLMLAWGKKESLVSAIESGLGTYFSRSRNGKWVKGEESGHLQHLQEIFIHLDPFYILYKTNQIGAACHTGYYSCFFRELRNDSQVSFVYSNKVGDKIE
ncbi:MAG: phosphoribosyl-AMP cyclohydrolase [Leptospira sp.]|jgi:phosphoribosyl-AMP cyclohydrolase|nr:phosphoribosyl-AMP cyclohydrolase [Leptospira sp.]